MNPKTNESKHKSGFFAINISNLSSKITASNMGKLIINQQFILIKTMNINNDYQKPLQYKAFKAIDTYNKRYATVYAFVSNKDEMVKSKYLKKNIKQELKQKIVPPTLWKGIQKVQNRDFCFQVHKKFGPSLWDILKSYKKQIQEKTLYVLTYQLLKLLDKIDNAGYCIRTLMPHTLILSQSINKTNIYLLNPFDLQKKGQQYGNGKTVPLKYCSIGSILKLNNSSKDMVESMCYILIDFYIGGKLFDEYSKSEQIFQAKSLLYPNYMPQHFIEFYNYVKNTNHSQDIKFSEWKAYFKKLVGSDISKAYQWVTFTENAKKSDLYLPSKLQNYEQESKLTGQSSYIPEGDQYIDQEKLQVNFSSHDLQLRQDMEEYIQTLSVSDKMQGFQYETKALSHDKKY